MKQHYKRMTLICIFFLNLISIIRAEVYWNLSNDGTLTISGTGEIPDCNTIPGRIIGEKMVYPPWYDDGSKIKKIVIEGGITAIGIETFTSCTNATTLIIGNTVKSIASMAFAQCWKLESVTIPNSVTTIKDNAFIECYAIASINIGNGLTNLANDAFSSCDALTNITVAEDNPVYKSIDGALFNKDITEILLCPRLKSGVFVIPNLVTSVNDYAFSGCKRLTSIIIGNSVTKIGIYAFSGCIGLTSITIPDEVEKISNGAFGACTNLTSIIIPDKVKYIGSSAFNGCERLTSVIFGNSLKEIGQYAFDKCRSITSLELPPSLNFILNNAFRGCTALTVITIPKSVRNIRDDAFSGCTSLAHVLVEWDNPDDDVLCYGGEAIFGTLNIPKIKLYVPPGKTDVYKNSRTWKNFNITEESLPTGMEEVNNLQLFIYPNPASDYVTVKGLTGEETIRIFDLAGRVLFTHRTTKNEETFDISYLPCGLYLIQIDNKRLLKMMKK